MAPYQIISLYKFGRNSAFLINSIHQIIIENGGELNSDCLLLLNDVNEEEFEPEDISSQAESLERLSNWPSLGSITYEMPEGEVTITYEGSNQLIFAVIISIPNSILEKGKNNSWNRYLNIAREIHYSVNADRTIFDWGLIENGFKWNEELKRLNEGIISGNYKYLNLVQAKN